MQTGETRANQNRAAVRKVSLYAFRMCLTKTFKVYATKSQKHGTVNLPQQSGLIDGADN